MIDTVVTAPGSLGDVNPMLAIARGLAAAGREVIVVTAERYLPLAQKAGLATRALVDETEFSRAVNDPRLWDARKGLEVVFGSQVQGLIAKHYRWLTEIYQPGRTLLVSHVLDFAGRIFRDKHIECRHCVIVPAPAVLRSLSAPPQLSPSGWETHLPKFLLRGVYRLADRMVDKLIAPTINELRQEVGLPSVNRILDRWWTSPDLTLGLFPDWFSIPSQDLPEHMQCVGFPLADSGDLLPESAKQLVDQTLAPLNGKQPIIFAPGSAHSQAKAFLQSAAQACEKLNRPGVLLSSAADQLPQRLPPNVVAAAYLPFRELLPRACAIVHHGGIGTTSQSLAAGLPQVVAPMAFDQFDNAQRVKRLGCGTWLRMPSVTASKLAAQLQHVLDDSQIRAATGQIAQRLTRPTTPDDLARIILGHFSSRTH